MTVDGEDGSASVQAYVRYPDHTRHILDTNKSRSIISNPKNNTEFDARLAADQRAQLDRLMEQASDVQASTNETLNDPVYAEPRKESDGIVAKIARLRKKEQNLQSDISARFFGLA